MTNPIQFLRKNLIRVLLMIIEMEQQQSMFLTPEAITREWVQPIDCRLGMAGVAEDSISLVLTDPPYFLDGMSNQWDHAKLRAKVKPGVVGGLPVGMKFDRRQGRELYDFLLPIATEWLRILKPGGFALVFSQARLAHHTAMALDDAGFEIRDMMAWRYEGQAKAFTHAHFVRRWDISESEKKKIISELQGRKTPQLKPQIEPIIMAQAPREGTFIDNWLKHRTGMIDTDNPLIMPGEFPGQVIPVPKPREKHGHMAVKPVDLLRHLIRIFSATGEETIVLDPFTGTGSTGVAAIMEKRGFMGFEINEAMADIANKRIANSIGNSDVSS